MRIFDAHIMGDIRSNEWLMPIKRHQLGDLSGSLDGINANSGWHVYC